MIVVPSPLRLRARGNALDLRVARYRVALVRESLLV
jgi:hypothetical protein